MNDTESADGPPAGTRAQLIQGTLQVLSERGLRGASSRSIASASGVNLGGITYHFGSKDDLISEALLEAAREWVAPALEVLRSDADPATRMIRAIQALQDSLARARDLLPVYLEALVHTRHSDALRRGVAELTGDLRSFLADQIRALQSTGFLPAWIDPEPMAMLIVATGDGLALHAAVDPRSVQPQAVAAQAIQLLLAASANPPTPAGPATPP